MTSQEATPAAGGGEGRSDQVGAGSVTSLRRWPTPRPDLWESYPRPETNLRHAMPYGLTRAELRAEWKRCAAAGFADWELRLRLDPRKRVAA